LIEPSRAAVVHRSVKTRAQRNAARTPASCRSRARARECVGTGSRSATWLSGFALARLLARRPTAISHRRSFGSLSVRRHSRRSGRRARSPSPDGAPAVPGFVGNTLSLRARVGRGPLATPVHSTDVCNSRFCFQGMLALRLGALHAVFSPRGAGTLGSRRAARFSERAGPSERCLLRSHRLRVPLTPRRFAGFPGRARLRPPASARRSSCDDPRVVPESLGFLRQAA